MSRFTWVPWSAATVIIATLVHLGSMYELPRLVTARALARMGPPNAMHFAPRSDETSRTVVRPSPDLLYAACPFDLSKGPLKVTARVPHSTYWSVAAYDAAANNFFVRDAMQITGDAIEIIALRRGTPLPHLDNAAERIVLFAPTAKGVVLIRLFINDEKSLPALDALRRQATCETVAAN